MTLLSFMNEFQISCMVEAFGRFGKSSGMLIFEKSLYFLGPVKSALKWAWFFADVKIKWNLASILQNKTGIHIYNLTAIQWSAFFNTIMRPNSVINRLNYLLSTERNANCWWWRDRLEQLERGGNWIVLEIWLVVLMLLLLSWWYELLFSTSVIVDFVPVVFGTSTPDAGILRISSINATCHGKKPPSRSAQYTWHHSLLSPCWLTSFVISARITEISIVFCNSGNANKMISRCWPFVNDHKSKGNDMLPWSAITCQFYTNCWIQNH